MNKYSVWYMPYNKKYLITHPWKWVKCAWHCLRDAWRRSVYGWTYGDVWDWDSWFLHVAPDMLRHMADKGCGYPGRPPFETPERWHDWLHQMADLLDTGREDWQDEHNEYREEYDKHLMESWKPANIDKDDMLHFPVSPHSEIYEKYMTRAMELRDQGEDNVRRAMTLMAEHFSCLWD